MSDQTPAGWYHAEGDPPGTQRYWDGSVWVGGPQPVGQTAVGGPGQPPWIAGDDPAGYSGAQPREESRAGTALGLAIFGFVCCMPAGVVGAVMAYNELGRIREGARDPSKKGMATAALIIGVLSVVFAILAIAFTATSTSAPGRL